MLRSSAIPVAAVVGAVATAMSPLPAMACGAALCGPGYFVPGDEATIPSNAPALGWHAPSIDDPASALRLLRIDVDPPAAIDFSLEEESEDDLLILPAALEPGARYRLEASGGECPPEPVEFEVAAEAPLPTHLGETVLAAKQRRRVRVANDTGSCFSLVPANTVDVQLDADPEAEPWAALFRFETLVDDELWQPFRSLDGDGGVELSEGSLEQVFARCPQRAQEREDGTYDAGVAGGLHSVQLRATLPGHPQVYLAEAASVRLECNEAGGCSAVPASRGLADLWPALLAVAALATRWRRRRPSTG